jgi:hypothetical protein
MNGHIFEREALLCADLAVIGQSLKATNTTTRAVGDIIAALNESMECVRYLNTRRSKNAILKLESEADVQDAVFLMLRAWITDLTYETPGDKSGNRYTIKDFLAPAARTIIEAKYIRDPSHGRAISKELHDDIEMYRRHPKCDDLIFFVYDPDSSIPDARALRSDIVVDRVYDGKPLRTHLMIKP